MKFGQAMSVFEAALPEEMAGPYRATLTKLQDAAPPLPAKTVHKVLPRGLGPQWRRRFPSFDDTPAAAASIGQVHRAVCQGRPRRRRQGPVPGRRRGAALGPEPVSPARAGCSASLVPGLDVKPLLAELRGPGRARSSTTRSRPSPSARSPRRTRTTRTSSSRTWSRRAGTCSSPSGSRARRSPRSSPTAPTSERDHAGPLPAVPVLRAGPRRPAARRPAPGQLPPARRRPARRPRLRRRRAAARTACRRPSAGCCAARSPATPRRSLDGLREEGFVKPGMRSTPSPCSTT